MYLLEDGNCPTTFNVFLNYKSQLRAYSKKLFDPFCRHERTVFKVDDDTAKVINDEISDDIKNDVRQAAEECPVEAIKIVE